MNNLLDRATGWLSGRDEDPDRPFGISPGWILLGLFLLAYLLRVLGVDWGFKNGDERPNFAAKVLAGELTPPSFFYPPLNNYLTAICFGVMFVVGRVLGFYHSIQDFKDSYFENVMSFYMVGRFHTAMWGALLAPVAALIARRFELSWRSSFGVGLIFACLAPSVWWSHVAKPETGMVGGCLLLGLSILAFLDDKKSYWMAAAVGVSAAIAVGFKHNAIFLVMPLMVACAVLAYLESRDVRQTLIGAAIAIVAGAISWSILSIGILLALQDFIDYQLIQAQMSNRPFTLSGFMRAVVGTVADIRSGATPIMFVGALLVPIFERDRRVLGFWAATLFGFLWVSSIVGDRTTPGLLMGFTCYFALTFAVTAFRLWERSEGPQRWGSAAALSLAFLLTLTGTGIVLDQALAAPAGNQVRAFFEANADRDDWVLAADPETTGLLLSVAAIKYNRARHERIAEKYDVVLPPAATEWEKHPPNPLRTWNVVKFPWAIGGIEHLEEDEVTVVKAFSWPRQNEEWKLDYWLSRGFHWYIVLNEEYQLTDNLPTYRAFHHELVDRCEMRLVVPARKPLFFEEEARIYDCRATEPASAQLPQR